jgi:two-component system, NtrC family, sensor kinase
MKKELEVDMAEHLVEQIPVEPADNSGMVESVSREVDNPIEFISGSLVTFGRYLERLDDFIQAQSDLIEMVTGDGSAAGLREKRKALKIDQILEDGRKLVKDCQDVAERLRSIVQHLN